MHGVSWQDSYVIIRKFFLLSISYWNKSWCGAYVLLCINGSAYAPHQDLFLCHSLSRFLQELKNLIDSDSLQGENWFPRDETHITEDLTKSLVVCQALGDCEKDSAFQSKDIMGINWHLFKLNFSWAWPSSCRIRAKGIWGIFLIWPVCFILFLIVNRIGGL